MSNASTALRTLAPAAVVAVDPAPDVADDGPADQDRERETAAQNSDDPDAEQEVALGLAHHVGDQRADPDADEPGDRRLRRLAADQPPDQDQCGHAERRADRRHQPEQRGDGDEDQDGQRRVDQAADAAHLLEDGVERLRIALSRHGSDGHVVADSLLNLVVRVVDRLGAVLELAHPAVHPQRAAGLDAGDAALAEPDQHHRVGAVEQFGA